MGFLGGLMGGMGGLMGGIGEIGGGLMSGLFGGGSDLGVSSIESSPMGGSDIGGSASMNSAPTDALSGVGSSMGDIGSGMQAGAPSGAILSNSGAVGSPSAAAPKPDVFSPPASQAQPASSESLFPGETYGARQQENLGTISAKYESGGRGPGTISSGRGDPGGVSYGTHQLASKTGTLNNFLSQSGYQKQFGGMKPGTPAFNNQWKTLAKDPKFGAAQHQFISKTHYQPVRAHADRMGLPNTRAVNESLWSMGVQHGRANTIINRAGIKPGMSEAGVVNRLYDARSQYVQGIKLPAQTRSSLLNRYKSERQDVMKLIKPGSI